MLQAGSDDYSPGRTELEGNNAGKLYYSHRLFKCFLIFSLFSFINRERAYYYRKILIFMAERNLCNIELPDRAETALVKQSFHLPVLLGNPILFNDTVSGSSGSSGFSVPLHWCTPAIFSQSVFQTLRMQWKQRFLSAALFYLLCPR